VADASSLHKSAGQFVEGAVNDVKGPSTSEHSSKPTRLAREFSNKRVPIVAFLGIMLSAVVSYILWALITANGPNPNIWPWVQPVTAAATVVFGVVVSIAVLVWAAGQSFTRATRDARQQIDGQDSQIYVNGSDSTVNIYTKEREGDSGHSSQLMEPDAQESMLTEIYSHGLAQAKLSFFISLIFAILGSIVLLSGAGLAVAHAANNGQRYAAILAQVSGVVINLLAGVLFLQSNRARKDMGAQGVMLRNDSRSDRRLKAAGLLADSISDKSLQNHVKAQMALQLVDSDALVLLPHEDHTSGGDHQPGTKAKG
jgi:hypothetical protein